MRISKAAVAALFVAIVPALLMWSLVAGTHEPGGYEYVGGDAE